MPFKLEIQTLVEKAGDGVSERSYDKDVVTIGRQESNELMLRDQRRLVSGRHAEIRQKGDQFILVDLGSKNGTQLNGERLASGKEYPLGKEDQIGIGDFVIRFHPIQRAQEKAPAADGGFESTMFFSETANELEGLFEDLNRAFWDHRDESPEERRPRLEAVLRDAIRGLDEVQAKRILDLAESRFPEPGYQQERVLKGPSGEESDPIARRDGADQSTHEALMKIAARYFDNTEALNSPEKMALFVERIDRVISVMAGSLADAVKGRREFEEGFDVASTRIFSWKQNPIKMAEGERDIGAYLFESKEGEGADKVISDLQEAFMDLALHQMGLIAGFREGLGGLLKQLDPATLSAEAKEAPLRLGPLKIPLSFWPFSGFLAWNRFRKKHRELSENEVKTFETVLGPHFAKGYLSIQKKKRVS